MALTEYEKLQDGTVRAVPNGALTPAQAAALAGAAAGRSTRLRVALFGDSTANAGTMTVPDAQQFDSVTAPFPATGATTIGGGELAKWGAHLYYPKAQLVFNGGVSGNDSASMLARDAAAASTMRKAVADLVNARPDVIIVRGASINDLAGATAANLAATVATSIARHRAVLARLSSCGVPIIDVGCYGYGPTGSAVTNPDPATVRLGVVALREAQRAAAAEMPLVAYLDPVAAGLSDSAGNLVAKFTSDGVHLNSGGGAALARAEGTLMQALFGVCQGPAYPGVDLIASGYMQATVGWVNGGIRPSGGWTAPGNATGGRIETAPDGTQMWLFEQPLQAGVQQLIGVTVPFPIATMGLLAGDIVGAELPVYIGAPAAPANVDTYYGRLDLYKTGAGRVVVASTQTAIQPIALADLAGVHHHVFPPLLMSEPSSALAATSIMVMQLTVTSPTAQVVTVGVGVPRLVKL